MSSSLRAAQSRQVRRLLLAADHVCEQPFHKLLSDEGQDELSAFASFPCPQHKPLAVLKPEKNPPVVLTRVNAMVCSQLCRLYGSGSGNDGSVQQQSWFVKLSPKRILISKKWKEKKEKGNDPTKATVQWQG